ncbi:hypothetical protein [Phascolarctobacterium succinatutens]|uniref:hypothetical protein n=1 Tax=Phascolarctobacterium succinatutens TaxID=626940 RepID=UPI0026F2F3E4|nr:hypothetical protein [Phascolarctobacterium succinatutens]
MNFIDSFCSNIKKVIALIALMLLLTLVILIFTHTSLGYFLVLLPITLLIIYLLHKMKELDEQESFFHSVVLAVLAFILVLFELPKEGVLLAAVVYAAKLLYKYNRMLHPQEEEQQHYNNNIDKIKTDSADDYVPLITYDDTCPDDGEDYGPEGSVIWGPRTIEENICINGKWYINENSEEWEENEGC